MLWLGVKLETAHYSSNFETEHSGNVHRPKAEQITGKYMLLILPLVLPFSALQTLKKEYPHDYDYLVSNVRLSLKNPKLGHIKNFLSIKTLLLGPPIIKGKVWSWIQFQIDKFNHHQASCCLFVCEYRNML